MAEYYIWRDQYVVPTKPASIVYDRFWRLDLEPAPEAYIWDKLDLAIMTAASRGRKFAFRIRAQGEVGDWHVAWPKDENDLTFLAGHQRFIRTLAIHLWSSRLMEHIAWVDISYGSWGEGADIAGVSDESLMDIIGSYLTHFPKHVQLLIPGKTRAVALEYAFTRPNMGWRVDNLGGPDDYFKDFPSWMFGKFAVGEFRNPVKMMAEGGHYELAEQQVHRWAIRYVGNGNLPDWTKLDAGQKMSLLKIGIPQVVGDDDILPVEPAVRPQVWPPRTTYQIGKTGLNQS